MDGKPAIRLGLAKLPGDRGEVASLIRQFRADLVAHGVVRFEQDEPAYQFGSLIPIGGALREVQKDNILLIGDAAGLCGAFAADGIKGSVVSGKEAAKLIPRFLEGKAASFQKNFWLAVDHHGHLLEYYRRQRFYRWVWDLLKCDRTFRALYDIIKGEKATFLEQFCDSKDKRKHLSHVVLKPKYIGKLLKAGIFVLVDILFGKRMHS